MKIAEEKVCKCETKSIVQLTSVDNKPHELENLDQYYCNNCNSFWREP